MVEALIRNGLVYLTFIFLMASSSRVLTAHTNAHLINSAVFLSPKIKLAPGEVANKFFYDVQFPQGHIAIKSFNGEVVDEAGNPIPLHETYLHHWLVQKFYQPRNKNPNNSNNAKERIDVRNNGVCQGLINAQYFGLGSETRRTVNHLPEPYAIEVGNPDEIPSGCEEKWMLNVHAIDTRGVVDKLGCVECRCDLYNATHDEYGRRLPAGYMGGLYCCYDQMQCRKQKGFQGQKRAIYFKYYVEWVDWNRLFVPLKVYILDVTDDWRRLDDSASDEIIHDCKVEYEMGTTCNDEVDKTSNAYIHVKRKDVPFRNGGYLIYGVGHQHVGGVGLNLYGQEGRILCSSAPTYGEGDEAGNEKGYVVGMSTCHPKPGSVKIMDGEMLTMESNYNYSQRHFGVMGLVYLLIAQQLPQNKYLSNDLYSYNHQSANDSWY